MPSTPYGTRELVSVLPHARCNFRYGFYTNTTEATRTVLGQTPAIVNGEYIAGLVIGANAPKPGRVRKYRTGGGFDTSFVDVNQIANARNEGWKLVSRPKLRRGANTRRSHCVYIRFGATDEGTGEPTGPQIKYAWQMPKYLYDILIAGDRAALGIKDATAGDEDLVFGARYPEPPRATYSAISAEGSISSRTTFVDPAALNSLPTGWAPADRTQEL